MADHDNHNGKVTPAVEAIANILADAILRKREHDYLEQIAPKNVPVEQPVPKTPAKKKK